VRQRLEPLLPVKVSDQPLGAVDVRGNGDSASSSKSIESVDNAGGGRGGRKSVSGWANPELAEKRYKLVSALARVEDA
jgi:hypothetical protein